MRRKPKTAIAMEYLVGACSIDGLVANKIGLPVGKMNRIMAF